MFRWLRHYLPATLAVSCSAQAAIFGNDDRYSVPVSSESVYAPIGLVASGSRRGTGFLVSDCHVLTAKHVLSDFGSVTGRSTRFSAANLSSRGVVIVTGNFDVRDKERHRREGRNSDWALIRLDQCLGAKLGYARLLPIDPGVVYANGTVDRRVQSAGYPGGRARYGLVVDPSCTIIARRGTSGELLHDCAALPGNSGGPIFRASGRKAPQRIDVYALVTGGDHDRRPRQYGYAISNIAAPVVQILPEIRAYLTDNRTEKIRRTPDEVRVDGRIKSRLMTSEPRPSTQTASSGTLLMVGMGGTRKLARSDRQIRRHSKKQ